jgi:hypothetical protein
MATRAKSTCPIFGPACNLPDNVLPTIANVMGFLGEKKSTMASNTSNAKIIPQVDICVTERWIKAGIPTVSLRRVEQKLEGYLTILCNVMGAVDIKETLKIKKQSE